MQILATNVEANKQLQTLTETIQKVSVQSYQITMAIRYHPL